MENVRGTYGTHQGTEGRIGGHRLPYHAYHASAVVPNFSMSLAPLIFDL